MANGHGGKRAGAGRKPRAERFGPQLEAAEARCVRRLPQHLGNLEQLADGGYEQVTETWEPAGLTFVEAPLLGPDGAPRMDANGRPIVVRQQAFPDLAPDTLVCVRRTRSIAAPDRAANIYLIDRAMGKPVAQVAGEMQLNAGEELIATFGAAVAKIYGGEGDS